METMFYDFESGQRTEGQRREHRLVAMKKDKRKYKESERQRQRMKKRR